MELESLVSLSHSLLDSIPSKSSAAGVDRTGGGLPWLRVAPCQSAFVERPIARRWPLDARGGRAILFKRLAGFERADAIIAPTTRRKRLVMASLAARLLDTRYL